MKVTLKLSPNQKKSILALHKLADQLSSLLDYVRELARKATERGRRDEARALRDYEWEITRRLSEVSGAALEIIDDSPQLTAALAKLDEANREIHKALEETAELAAKLTQVSTILSLVAEGLSVFAA